MRAPPRIAGAALLCGALSACSGSGPASTSSDGGTCSTFPAPPLSTVTTDAGKLRVEVRSAPYPHLVAGLQCVELAITDPLTGASIDGLTVTMTPWMTAMGHGASVTPTVAALGEGRYVLMNVSLFMPGEWQLRMQFSGQVKDSVEPTFSVD